MACTINWFKNESQKWLAIASESNGQTKMGHKAYAYRQADIWEKFREQSYHAFQQFIRVRNGYMMYYTY